MAKKCITVRLDEKTYLMIDNLSELSGESKNTVICGLLSQAVPHMSEVTKAWQLIKDNNPKGLSVLSHQITDVITSAMNAQIDLVDEAINPK